ncbi:MAG TPA: acetyltransferase [Solirubrobacteraceae bacterium]|jgi:sugar O-acyltransferase (sialic acid O-acetyltransferase NeuD family)|nr:acetyltransferase [Solirubrobacteraceae bacterium]
MSDKPVVIFGAGSYAQVATVYLADDSPRDVVAYTVNGEYVRSDTFSGLPLVAFEELLEAYPPDRVDLLIATGYQGLNSVRRRIYERCKQLGYGFVTYVSSRAMVMSDHPIGENTFVFEANVIQPFVEIGDNVILWSGNHIGHHSRVASHCFIASHAVISGHVTIGESCFVGVNATFRDGISIAPRCVVGAGAIVLADQEEGTVLAAAPTPVHPKKSWQLRNI